MMPESHPLLELRHVSVRYNRVVALDDINLRINVGEQVAVLGPNGAGKSTLFDVLAGLRKPDHGSVRVHGGSAHRQTCIGYVTQRAQIDDRFPVTVRDVVMMGRTGQIGLLRWPDRQDRQLVEEALRQVEMHAYADCQIGELSGGQQQRVFIARALAQEARVLLLDEPLAGLDAPSQENILTILKALQHQRITILLATHDLNAAARYATRVLLLNRRIIASGPPTIALTSRALRAAYGGHLHILQPENGVDEPLTVLADSCCGGATAAHSLEREPALSPPTWS